MSRYIEALEYVEGEFIPFWCFSSTQHNLIMDFVQRILTDEIKEYGLEIITLDEIKSNLIDYEPFFYIIESEEREKALTSINKLIEIIEKKKIKEILFKKG